MLSKTHKLVEALTTAIGPIFRDNPDYDIIQQAMGLVIARIAQATPLKGEELLELGTIHAYSRQALHELIKLEKDKKAIVDKAINGLTDLAAINGGLGAEARDMAEEKQAEESWANSTIHQAIQDHEAEEAEQAWNDTLKEQP